ncbi:hypothetical protein DFQ01_11070 [Paenibacillus cellulosilyticus]|uniref:Uncharacterized protein n=1 Tax=Paenibacillus cellulosilyticus TaxID=375489 RepID=A0A2V2YUY8_9BACL|nr:hypothetical protein [Paenibacillus cellulosilyticus]PWW01180.1 hypothetical protein DFQ01_11070 [Paenibacillus cellulosilyticus]QKS46860.1 hypothetical protein HUB94_20470 [Paenibacillus cellulosilyticus]
MENSKNRPFPYEREIMELNDGEQLIIHLSGTAFVIRPATNEDLDMNHCGVMDM